MSLPCQIAEDVTQGIGMIVLAMRAIRMVTNMLGIGVMARDTGKAHMYTLVACNMLENGSTGKGTVTVL